MHHSGTSTSAESTSESDNEYVCKYTQAAATAAAAGQYHHNYNGYPNTNGVYNVVQKFYQTPYNTQQGYDNYGYQANYAYLPNYYSQYGHLQHQTIPRNKNAQILSVRYLVQPTSAAPATPKYPKVANNYYEYQHQQKNLTLPYHTNAAYNYNNYMNALMHSQHQQQQQQQQQHLHQQQQLQQQQQQVVQVVQSQQQRVNFSAASSTATTLYNEHRTFEYPHDVPTYEMSQKQQQQQQLNKVASVESNLRFLSMGGLGGSANLNIRNDDFNTQNMDNEEQKIRKNIAKGNYLDINIEPKKSKCSMKAALITAGVIITVIAVILGCVLGFIYRGKPAKTNKEGLLKQLVLNDTLDFGVDLNISSNATKLVSLNQINASKTEISQTPHAVTKLQENSALEARILNKNHSNSNSTTNAMTYHSTTATTVTTSSTTTKSETIALTTPSITTTDTTTTPTSTTTLTTTTTTATTTATTTTTTATSTIIQTKSDLNKNMHTESTAQSMVVHTITMKLNESASNTNKLEDRKSLIKKMMKPFH